MAQANEHAPFADYQVQIMLMAVALALNMAFGATLAPGSVCVDGGRGKRGVRTKLVGLFRFRSPTWSRSRSLADDQCVCVRACVRAYGT